MFLSCSAALLFKQQSLIYPSHTVGEGPKYSSQLRV